MELRMPGVGWVHDFTALRRHEVALGRVAGRRHANHVLADQRLLPGE